MRLFLILISLIACSAACSRINNFFELEDDNLIEEVIEFAIDENIGVNIDLTPESKE